MRAGLALLGACCAAALAGGGRAEAPVRCTPTDPKDLEAQLRRVLEPTGGSDGEGGGGGGGGGLELPEPALELLRKGAKKLSKLRKKKGDQDLLSIVAGGSAEHQRQLVDALSAALFAAVRLRSLAHSWLSVCLSFACARARSSRRLRPAQAHRPWH